MKWKVLVADDEPVILNGIKKLIEDCRCDCEVAAVTYDGEEAIRKIEEVHPHIVVSDIQMPGKTGLEMIQTFYNSKECPQFIFISGYHEFEYVQEAIKYQAVNFLLKPVTLEELEQSLIKAIAKIQDYNTLNVVRQKKDDVEKFFEKIYEGYEYSEKEFYNQFCSMGIQYAKCSFVSVCFCIKEKREETDNPESELTKFVVYNHIIEYFKKSSTGFMTKRDKSGCHIMLVSEHSLGKEKVREVIRKIREGTEKEYSVELIVGAGEEVKGSSGLYFAFKTASFAREIYWFEERPVIFASEVHHEFYASFEEYEDAVWEVIQNFILGECDTSAKAERVMNLLKELHYGNRQAAVSRTSVFIETVFERLKDYHLENQESAELKEKLIGQIYGAETFAVLSENIIKGMKRLDNIFRKDNTLKAKREIAKVIDYIRVNYKSDITLAGLAGLAGMNPAYFSVFFKKNMGENYQAYLTKIRMENAHRLLMSTDMLTYEIAEAVGYNTVKRFTDAFKRIYGATPMDYKKKYRETENNDLKRGCRTK